MSEESVPLTKFKLQASEDPKDDEEEFILNQKTLVVSVENNNQVNEEEIKLIKSSTVKKEDQIELKGKDTLFQFSCKAIDDKLCLKLTEIDAVSPFYYLREIDRDGLEQKHRLFKSLENLEKAAYHINRLFKQGRIQLDQEKEDEIIFKIKADYISEEVSFDIEAERKMTDKPDAMMLKLYKIQKQKNKMIKEIENLVLNGNCDSKTLAKKIEEVKHKYEE